MTKVSIELDAEVWEQVRKQLFKTRHNLAGSIMGQYHTYEIAQYDKALAALNADELWRNM